MPPTARAMADLVELAIKTALAPIVARVRVLEQIASSSRASSLDDRDLRALAKAQADLQVHIDEHVMVLAAGFTLTT